MFQLGGGRVQRAVILVDDPSADCRWSLKFS